MPVLTRDSPRCEPSPAHQVPLRPHQLAMLHACKSIEGSGKRLGVLADLPGAGKTYVALALILESSGQAKKTNVIVVPQNIYGQWMDAIRAFCGPGFSHTALITYADVSKVMFDPSVLQTYDAIVTTPLYYRLLTDCLEATRTRLSRVFIDEVDSVEFFIKSKRIDCEMLWLISASFTPDVARSLGYSDVSDRVVCRCDPGFVAESFTELREKPRVERIICSNVYLDHVLRGLFDEDQYGAMNAMDFSGAAKGTNGANTQTATSDKQAVEIMLKDLVRSMHGLAAALDKYPVEQRNMEERRLAMAASLDQMQRDITEAAARMQNPEMSPFLAEKVVKRNELQKELAAHVRTQVDLEIRRAADEVELARLKGRYDTVMARLADNDLCAICYEAIEEDKAVVTCCQQAFCWGCLSQWMQSVQERTELMGMLINFACPYCRTDFDKQWTQHVIRIQASRRKEEEEAPQDNARELPQKEMPGQTKMNALEALLTDGRLGPKVIIFSDYRKVFDRIAERMQSLHITYTELNGGTIQAIERDVRGYRSGPTRVLLCNSSLYGCGMNLEMTSDIVFVHKTKPAMFEQVVGRAQRPGRTSRLRVYELLHENELDM